jgi:gamma-glutamyltranspeptidase / glutathione hydrolase
MSAHRGVVYCRKGGAAASQPLAVSAALSILQRGGSFIDAGIACSAVLAVVEPSASHIGGDAFLVTHLSSKKETLAFNGSGEATHSSNADEFVDGIPFHGFKAATVPGLVSTWFAAHERYGKLSFEDILMPAITYAESGFPANAEFVRLMQLQMAQYPDSTIFSDMGIPSTVDVGDIVIQKNLALSLRAILEGGRAAFYQGSIAQKIISASNGWISAEDLNQHTTRISEPLHVTFRGLTVYGQPPPSQGVILLQELLLADKVNLSRYSTAQLKVLSLQHSIIINISAF